MEKLKFTKCWKKKKKIMDEGLIAKTWERMKEWKHTYFQICWNKLIRDYMNVVYQHLVKKITDIRSNFTNRSFEIGWKTSKISMLQTVNWKIKEMHDIVKKQVSGKANHIYQETVEKWKQKCRDSLLKAKDLYRCFFIKLLVIGKSQ